jgi:AbrB family looped-hinge helix DNA binding protein
MRDMRIVGWNCGLKIAPIRATKGHDRAWFRAPSRGRIFLPMATHNSTLEYLTTTKIGEKGQLTVPKQFREDLGLGIGAPFAVLRLGDGLILMPEQQRFEQLCQQLSSSLTAVGLNSRDVLATLPQARNRVYARRYGKKLPDTAVRRRSRSRRGK